MISSLGLRWLRWFSRLDKKKFHQWLLWICWFQNYVINMSKIHQKWWSLTKVTMLIQDYVKNSFINDYNDYTDFQDHVKSSHQWQRLLTSSTQNIYIGRNFIQEIWYSLTCFTCQSSLFFYFKQTIISSCLKPMLLIDILPLSVIKIWVYTRILYVLKNSHIQ